MGYDDRPLSGTFTATATAAPLPVKELKKGVTLQVGGTADSIQVRSAGAAAGLILPTNSVQFIPAKNLSDVLLIRGGITNVAVSYWAY